MEHNDDATEQPTTQREAVHPAKPRNEHVESLQDSLFADSNAFISFLFDEFSRITP
jgi:hypothetical protein